MLKALELVGFKSFADKTRFEFPAGITVVVGPNGSGKSNIVDAMKWVLGEQSAKSLRGKDMADVIFKGGGSGSRKPMNMAEATIIFDNSGGQLPMDAPEVHVTRRVYRSGEGEYLINRQPCRLKDIRDLFRGTGVGVDAYSLIEQGKVDRLLNASSKDRRAIFEEAAGISRFKAKKIEAQRRLERVDQNLLRLRDIVEEVENRLKTVRAQAAKAKRYREYSDRLQELRTQVGLVDWRALTSKLTELETSLALLRDEVAQVSAALEAQEQRSQTLEGEVSTGGEQLRGVEAKSARNREQIAGLESQVEYQRTRVKELAEEADRLRQNIATMSTRVVDSLAKLRETTAQATTAEVDHGQVAAALTAIERAQAELTKHFEQLRQQGESLRRDHAAQFRAAAQLSSQVSTLETQQATATMTVERCQTRLVELASATQEIERELDELRSREVDLVQAMAQRTTELEALQKEIDVQRRLFDRRQEDLHETQAKLRAVSARAGLLDELENKFEGFTSGVKALLQAKDTDTAALHEIRGVVADFIRAPVEWAPLIDVALGPAAQHVVIEGDDLLAALSRGEAKLPGRVGLVQLNTHSVATLTAENDLAQQPGVIGRADSLVEADATNVDLVGRLLCRTWLVETLADAFRLQRLHATRRLKFVTRAGDVLDSDGTLYSGAGGTGLGLVSRRSELRAIKLELVAINNQIQSQQAELGRIGAEIQTHESQKQRTLAAQQADEKALAEQRFRERGAEERRSQLKRQQATLSADEALATAQQEGLAQQVEAKRAELQTSEENVGRFEAQLRENQEQIDSATREREARGKEVTTQRIALAKSEQRLEALRARLVQLQDDQRERERATTDTRSQLAQSLERQLLAERAILDATSQLAELYLQKESLAREMAAVVLQQQALLSERQSLADEVAKARRTLRQKEDAQHAQELSANEVRHERQTLADRLRDDYGIDLATLTGVQGSGGTVQENADPSSPNPELRTPDTTVSLHNPAESERTDVEEEIAALRRKINNIGAVNMDALTELDDLEARFAHLNGQYNDLMGAKDALEKIINKINNDSRRLFVETLEAIRTNFQVLYRKAFGGGKADIVLEEGVDILEAGVEIIATPPGKPSFNNSLLSGGEKALTAVALLLAIFQFRPSPFCVLDEVDAPFDEANIGRFVDVLRDFLNWTKFVVVTHSKKTMTAATTLYGVTMQESGVSKRVSVRFEDVSEDGHISQEAVDRSSDDVPSEENAA